MGLEDVKAWLKENKLRAVGALLHNNNSLWKWLPFFGGAQLSCVQAKVFLTATHRHFLGWLHRGHLGLPAHPAYSHQLGHHPLPRLRTGKLHVACSQTAEVIQPTCSIRGMCDVCRL